MTTSAHPSLTVQPIHFTSDFESWERFYRQLGLEPAASDGRFLDLLAADSGMVLLEEVPAGSQLDGVKLVEFAVPSLDAYSEALGASVPEYLRTTLGQREAIVIDLPQGRVHVYELPAAAQNHEVHPKHLNLGALLYGPAEDIPTGTQVLETHGLTPRIASQNGGWTDLVANGIFAFHDGELRQATHEAALQPAIEVFGETGDIDAYLAQLEERGVKATIIDEAYGRSLRIIQPDGTELWVNETMHDLYGYRRLDQ